MTIGSDGPAEKDIIRDKVRKLYSAYQKGYLGGEKMPEKRIICILLCPWL